jgi:hypothetical protein
VPREAALSGSGCEKRRNTVEKLWEVDPTPVKNLGNDLCFEIWEKGRNGCYIAEVRGEANARLIAAAPDMYEALREELEILCAWKITAKVPDGLREDIDISIENIRNVLAKAEGK